MQNALRIADKTFSSRLFVGTGKYSTFAQMVQALEASGAQVVTVAVRRVNISDRGKESLLDYVDTAKYFILPNTAACFRASESVSRSGLSQSSVMAVSWETIA